jgi:hypothetical protein
MAAAGNAAEQTADEQRAQVGENGVVARAEQSGHVDQDVRERSNVAWLPCEWSIT